MARDISIKSMIKLPRLNGASAVTLGEQLLTEAASAGDLPVFLERPRGRLAIAVTSLKGEILFKEEEGGEATEADEDIDDAWRSFSEWLGSIAGMPAGSVEKLDAVRKLHALIFSQGLSFIILSYREEWAQSESRLKEISDGGYEETLRTLGGGPFLDRLKSAHAHYGDVLNIKTPQEETNAPAVRENMAKLAAEMKEYVAKVATYPDREEPGSAELSEKLLRPLVQWKSPKSTSQTKDDSSPAT